MTGKGVYIFANGDRCEGEFREVSLTAKVSVLTPMAIAIKVTFSTGRNTVKVPTFMQMELS